MRPLSAFRLTVRSAFMAVLLVGSACLAQVADKPSKNSETPEVNLLQAAQSGLIAVDAEGIGDGRMTVSITNRSRAPLRVVLPPGLIASGSTGQFGGMGGMGMGGGMGGGMMGGGMGGGMGGMGGGMMGGGMGGMGGGMGGMGGGMGGGMRGGMMGGGGTVPATMGMMMLGRMIMNLVGDRDSWDFSSLMRSMGGMGMGGMGGGMMGGGMGGMGGMGMGGMGGGFRSVPPTGLPFATIQPGQTRHLPTRLVSLEPPIGMGVGLPAKGEKLQLGDVADLNPEPRAQAALRRLAENKAPSNVAQLVLWRVGGKLDWPTIARVSTGWANAYEIDLAQQLVANLEMPATDTELGRIFIEVKSTDSAAHFDLCDGLKDRTMLGLKVETHVPTRPTGPAIACKIQITGDEAVVQLARSNGKGHWAGLGKLTLVASRDSKGKLNAVALADAIAESVVNRLVEIRLKRTKGSGKEAYRIEVVNHSPMILNGVALSGAGEAHDEMKKLISGLCISPFRILTFPASEEAVDRMALKSGIRVVGADLSGL